MECEQVRERLEAYALGTLDTEELEAVELHLASCADCQGLAKELADAAHALPEALAAVSPLQPPTPLKARVLQALGTVPDPALHRSPAPPRHRSRWRHARTLGALAAVLLAFAITWAVHLDRALARERALSAGLAKLAGQQELVLEVVDSSKATKVALRPPGGGSPSYGKLYTRPDLPYVVVMAARLPQPSPGHAYQLWLTGGGQTELPRVMAVNSEGFGLLVFQAPRDGPIYERALLTLQPKDSGTPLQPPVLVWPAP